MIQLLPNQAVIHESMTRFVRCIDNTLAADVLTVGRVYEVLQIKERDGYYVLSLGRFTMTRFQTVSAAEAGYSWLRCGARPRSHSPHRERGLHR
jgi:hypothetical protein